MKKNKNIFWHIIEEDYKKKSHKQSQCVDTSEKVILITELQHKDASVIEQLEKLHQRFEIVEKSEISEPNDGLTQTKQEGSLESNKSLEDSELDVYYQRTVTEGKESLYKQDIPSNEQELRERLLKEIFEKKKVIGTLQLEILALQNSCMEISQELS
jgi:hypothetical protein